MSPTPPVPAPGSVSMPLHDLQKIAVKIPLALPPGAPGAPGAPASIDGFIALLDAWRMADGGDWVDVVDNAHLASGLAVQLVGRRHTIGVDLDRPLSWVHLHKRGLEGAPDERVRTVVAAALAEVAKLAADALCPAGVEVRLDALWLGVNDRVTCPNDDATGAALGPVFGVVADRLYGPGGWTHARTPDPRERFGWWLRPAAVPESLDWLRARI